jgi:hypothetical protein
LNIDNSANCYANAIASFLEHNPQAFDQVYLSLKSTRQKTLKVFEDTLAKVLA